MKEKLSRTLSVYTGKSFILWVIFIAIRFYETIALEVVSSSTQSLFVYGFRGLLYDTLTAFVLSGLFLLPYLFLSLLHEKTARVILFLYHFLCLLSAMILVRIFILELIPIDQVIFTYSFRDLLMAGRSSAGGNIFLLAPLVGALLLLIILNLKPQKKDRSKKVIYAFCVAALLAIPFYKVAYYDRHEGQLRNFVINNKLTFFVFNSIRYYREKETNEQKRIDPGKEGEKYRLYNPQWEFTQPDYPFLHRENTQDVLGSFFNLDKKNKPNIVFIIVESLSRSLVGNDSHYGNFTPFLDSLSRQSLYWPNFLSTAERTFNVLPSSLGSLPYAKNGFMEMGFKRKLPLHFTALSLLKENGYYARFYVGGWPHFNNMDGFLEEQGIDHIVDNWTPRYTKIAKDESGDSWGYPDDAIFKKSMADLNTTPIQQARFDLFLTVSSHAPFHTPNDRYYESLFEKQMNLLGFDENKKNTYRKNKEKFYSILYVDEAIRNFMETYKERRDFSNTIFFIFGDHAMPELHGDLSALEKYHVPLIVFSPLLKKSRRMEAVSSHLDIAPSLMAMLANTYGLELPNETHWLGTGLDTATDFRNIHSLAFMHNNKNLKEYISGNYFLSYNDVYLLKPGMEIELKEDRNKKTELSGRLANFIALNGYVPYSNKIVPEEAYKRSISNVTQLNTLTVPDVETKNPVLKEKKVLSSSCSISSSAKGLLVENTFEYFTTDTLYYTQPLIQVEVRKKDGSLLKKQELQFTRSDNSKMVSKTWNKVTCGTYLKLEHSPVTGLVVEVKIINAWERPSYYRNWKFDLKEVK